MKTFWNEGDRRELRDRLARLSPESRAQWGRMDAPRMVVHLCDGFRMASGELVCASKNLPIRFTPIKQLFIYVLPFPKSAPTAPELLARQPGAWSTDVQYLCTAMDRVVSCGPTGCAAEHPAFGKMTGKGWGVLAYSHMDHHLKQFGV
jgi:hypothetical protein